MKDRILYDRLDISPDLSIEQLKKEGKKLLLKWHPDKNLDSQEESTKKFKEIKEILDILTDPEKREKYHNFGIQAFENNSPPSSPFPFPFQNGFPFPFQFPFSFPFQAQTKEQIVYELNVDLEKMEDQHKFNLVYHRSIQCHSCKCKECNGSGNVAKMIQHCFSFNTCFICGGIGFFKDETCQCKGTLSLVEELKMDIIISKNMLKTIIENNHTITIKNPDHDLIIFPILST